MSQHIRLSATRSTVLTLALLLMAGCIDVRVRAGKRPNLDALERQLVMHVSTMDDVRALLGEPFGTGGSMLPMQDGARTTWSYYYEEGTLHDDRRIFLFVYFTPDERYEGYLWFSSLPAMAARTPTDANKTP